MLMAEAIVGLFGVPDGIETLDEQLFGKPFGVQFKGLLQSEVADPFHVNVQVVPGVTVALPVKSAGIATHNASLNAVTVYVVATEGDTEINLGLLVAETVTGVTPSVYVMLHGPVPVRAILKFVE